MRRQKQFEHRKMVKQKQEEEKTEVPILSDKIEMPEIFCDSPTLDIESNSCLISKNNYDEQSYLFVNHFLDVPQPEIQQQVLFIGEQQKKAKNKRPPQREKKKHKALKEKSNINTNRPYNFINNFFNWMSDPQSEVKQSYMKRYQKQKIQKQVLQKRFAQLIKTFKKKWKNARCSWKSLPSLLNYIDQKDFMLQKCWQFAHEVYPTKAICFGETKISVDQFITSPVLKILEDLGFDMICQKSNM